MTAFATSDDLAARLGITLTDDEATRAAALLDLATGLIQDHVGQKIALVDADTLTMPGTNADRIHLPERPVISVASVELDGAPLTENTDWWLNGDTIMRRTAIYSAAGLLSGQLDAPYLLGSGFGRPTQTLTIVYKHGYAAIPTVCRVVCIEAAVRCFVNPGAVARETVGNTSTVYDNNRFSPSGLLLTDLERRQLNNKFGTRAIAISIGA